MTSTTTSDRTRWMALYVLCIGVLMIVLDATIVNVALPSIQQDLGFSQSNLAWVVNAYLIAFGGLLLLAGRLGDLIGRRRVFLIGVAIFSAASLLCATAQSQEVLIGARFIQGAGGALTSAVVLGMIVTMFPEPREQAKAIGVYGFVASAGGSIGLLAGGVLTDLINWHWIFFVNIPVGIATAFFALRLIEPGESLGIRHGADTPGAALLTGGLMLGVYTILQVEQQGWGSTRTLGLAAVAVAAIVAFLVRQSRIENPLMPLRLFRSRNVSGANAVQGAARGRHVRDVLPRRAVPADDPRLHRAPGRARVPALDDRDGRDVAALLGPARRALRHAQYGPREHRLHRRRHAAVRPHAGRRQLLRRRHARDDPRRPRRRPRLPRPDDVRDDGRLAAGRRARLGPRQHERAGRRRGRPGRARDAGHRAHRPAWSPTAPPTRPR